MPGIVLKMFMMNPAGLVRIKGNIDLIGEEVMVSLAGDFTSCMLTGSKPVKLLTAGRNRAAVQGRRNARVLTGSIVT